MRCVLRRVPLYVLVLILAVGGGSLAYWLESSGRAEQALLVEPPSPGEPGGQADPDAVEDTAAPAPSGSRIPEPDPVDEVVAAPSTGSLYWGVHTADIARDPAAMDRVEQQTGARPAIGMFYQEWANEGVFPAEAATRLSERGIVPMVTWEAWEAPPEDPSIDPSDAREESQQPDYQLDRIIGGEFDRYIVSYANSVRAYEGPVMLRLFHEMDGFWYPWAGTVNGNEPEDVAAAWRHVHDLFEAAGATNVTWVWNVNHESVPKSAANDIDTYYPGDEYVDWVGISGFNFGTTSAVASWIGFDTIFADRLADLETYDKPVVIPEFAAPEQGGSKAAWIEDTFERMTATYPSIGAAVWFDREVADVRDWRITSSDAAQEAFRSAVARAEVLSAPSALETVVGPEPQPGPSGPSPTAGPSG